MRMNDANVTDKENVVYQKIVITKPFNKLGGPKSLLTA